MNYDLRINLNEIYNNLLRFDFMNLSLEGKNAIVCGSTQGIGLASAEELALLGANCTLIARNEEALKAAIHSLDIALRQQHQYLVADFSKPEQVKAAIEAHVKETPVHILVNNTGGPPPGPVTEATEEQFLTCFQSAFGLQSYSYKGRNSFNERKRLWENHQYHFNFREDPG